ncbi:MAG: PHP domain-containing protein [Promethearchaeota archaeon]
MYPIDDCIRFTFKLFSIAVLVIGTIILIGYLILGFYFVSRYFMVIVQLGVRLSFVILLIKISYIVIKLLHPNLRLNYESNRRKKLPRKETRLSNYSRAGKREFIYLLGTAYLFLTANVLLISIPFPTHRIETNLAEDEFLFDFHGHTTMSDGWLTVEQRVMYYIKQGISGAAFSDHDNIRGAKAAQKFVEENELDFIVFMAVEWTDIVHDIHMNYYGIEETIVPPMSENPFTKVMNASEMIKYVKSKGGYVIVNHYNAKPNKNGGFGVPYNFTDLMNWGVDGFEIVNGDRIQDNQIREFCLNNSLICFGGSDVHTNEDLNCFIKLRLDNPTNMSIVNIFQNLARNDHEVIAIKLHSDAISFPDELKELGFEIFEDYLNYLLNLNSLQVLSWILWSCLFYLLLFMSYRKVKKSNLSRLRDKIT